MDDAKNLTALPTDKQKLPQVATPEVTEEFADKMEEIHLMEKEAETKVKADILGLAYLDLAKLPILPEAIGTIPQDEATAAKVLCFEKKEDNLKLAIIDPSLPAAEELIAKLKKQAYQLELYLVSPHGFEKGLWFYRSVPAVKKIQRGVTIEAGDLEKFKGQFATFQDLADRIRKVSVTDLISFVIASAIEARASDIHLETEADKIVIRYRIDGILHQIVDLPKTIWEKLDSRIKLIANLKINISDKPQDGGFTITSDKEKIDVRVSTIPTNYGESVVLRLLMSSSTSIKFDDLGIGGKAYADLDREIKKPNGMIITTGPTGSGKTTTLYAILNKLNNPETKIITLEDPIEYKLEGINQSQVKTDETYTFAKGLRSILRQDPDIIMVGEIRDLDTAETAINAALTGHLVISTLHTNSAAATIPRLLSMGVKPFLLAPALNAMMGQRLVRRICEHCKEETQIDNRTMSEVIEILSKLKPETGEHNRINDLNNLKFFHGKGCSECKGLGYLGRIGIYEIMAMSPEIEKLLLAGQVSEYQMQDLAVAAGMVTMIQDGLLKALDGITTVEEIFRVAKDV